MEQQVDDFIATPRGMNAREWLATFEAHFADRVGPAMGIIHERAMSLLHSGMHPEDVARTMKLPTDLLATMMVADMEITRAHSQHGAEGIARMLEHAQRAQQPRRGARIVLPPHAMARAPADLESIFAGLAIPREMISPEEKLRADVFAAFEVISGHSMMIH